MKKYFNRVTVAFSILINTLLGGGSNQTFSARNYQRKRDGKLNLVTLIDKFFWWENDHCFESWIKWTIINHSIKRYNEDMGYSKSRSPFE
jgi:hypothetical protein